MKIGLKVWSTNRGYIEPARALFAQGAFDYIELFTVPGSAEEYLQLWQALPVPYILHAPHSYAGLNMSLADALEPNRSLLGEVERFAAALRPKHVIFHPGTIGTVEETCRQWQLFSKHFPSVFDLAAVENKPFIGLKSERCVGATIPEIKQIMECGSCAFCLDFGHAIASAASRGLPWKEELQGFIRDCAPLIFHLCDGDVSLEYDQHLNLGRGNYDLSFICRLLKFDRQGAPEPMITLETKKSSDSALNDFADEVSLLRRLWANA